MSLRLVAFLLAAGSAFPQSEKPNLSPETRGDIQMAIENYTAVQSHITDKAVIAVSSSGLVRTSFLPDVPTVKEAGGGDFEARSWNAIFALSQETSKRNLGIGHSDLACAEPSSAMVCLH